MYKKPSVGADRIRPNVTGLSRPLNGTVSDVALFNRVLPKNRGCGTEPSVEWYNVGRCPVQPGAIEKTGLRADFIRPYGLV